MRPLAQTLICLLLLAGCPAPKPAPNLPTEGGGPQTTSGDPGPTAADPGAPAVSLVADPALKAALSDLSGSFAQLHPAGLNITYVERGELLKRIEAWKADPAALPQAVIAPDPAVLKALQGAGLLDAPTLRTFAGDRLALVHSVGARWSSPSLHDIHVLSFRQLGLGSADTIAGYFGEQALISDGVYELVKPRILGYANLEALATGVISGRVELAMVLASTVVQHPELEVMLLPGADLHEDIRFQLAATAGHGQDPGVADLLRYLAEDEGAQTTLAGYGLLPRVQAVKEQR